MKIKQLTFVLFIFSAVAFSYPVSQGFAQGGGQCDSNPACNPASGTCCGQCDPGPACNPNDPNGIPCCGLEGNNNQHQDPMVNRGRDKQQGELRELREKLGECLQRERNSHQQQSRSTQHAPAQNCSGSIQQATSANQAINDICLDLAYVRGYVEEAFSFSQDPPHGGTQVSAWLGHIRDRIGVLNQNCRDLGRFISCERESYFEHMSCQ